MRHRGRNCGVVAGREHVRRAESAAVFVVFHRTVGLDFASENIVAYFAAVCRSDFFYVICVSDREGKSCAVKCNNVIRTVKSG